MSLRITPCTLREARSYVEQFHRHHRPPQGGLFAVACADAEKVRGVAIVGRPVSRMLDNGWTVEVTRVATDGARNACSMLYGAAWRAARALGYRRLITYTLLEEGGHPCAASASSVSDLLAVEVGTSLVAHEWTPIRYNRRSAGRSRRTSTAGRGSDGRRRYGALASLGTAA